MGRSPDADACDWVDDGVVLTAADAFKAWGDYDRDDPYALFAASRDEHPHAFILESLAQAESAPSRSPAASSIDASSRSA